MSATLATEPHANFVGTLIKRQHKPGQRAVQLLFKTGEGMQLSISRNTKLVRSLRIGETYHVRGALKTIGKKRCVIDPTTLPYTSKRSRIIRYAAFATVGCLLISGAIAATSLHGHSKPVSNKTQSTATHTESTPASTPTTPAAPAAETSAPAPAASTPSTPSAPTYAPSTSKKAAASTATQSSTPAPAAPVIQAAPQPAADTDTQTPVQDPTIQTSDGATTGGSGDTIVDPLTTQ